MRYIEYAAGTRIAGKAMVEFDLKDRIRAYAAQTDRLPQGHFTHGNQAEQEESKLKL
jgi:hypothetical protein